MRYNHNLTGYRRRRYLGNLLNWVKARWADESIQEVLFGAVLGATLVYMFFTGV